MTEKAADDAEAEAQKTRARAWASSELAKVDALTEAERESLEDAMWQPDTGDVIEAVERIVADRLAAVQAEADEWKRQADINVYRKRAQRAEAERDDARRRLAEVEALADGWNEVPDYTPSTYDQGRVDQRHDMTMALLEVLANPPAEDER